MGDIYPRFTVAAVQAAPVYLDRDKTIDKSVRLIEEAADKGANIIGFPELFVAGDPILWHMAKKTNPLPLQGPMFKQLIKNGVKIPSPSTERLCHAAKKAHAYVVIGVCEVDATFPGTVYVTALFISDTGEILGIHRKLVPTVSEKLVFSNGDGSHLNVYDTPYGKLSALNCGENTHSLYKYAVLAMGAQIHVSGWPAFPQNLYPESLLDSIDFRMQTFAHEGKIFIINSCGIVDEQNIAACCDTQEERDNIIVNTGGGSSIIGPSGQFLVGPVRSGEAVLTAEICLEDALPGKQSHNVLGHYNRWDVLSLNFNRDNLTPFKNPAESSSNNLLSELQKVNEKLCVIAEKLDKITEK